MSEKDQDLADGVIYQINKERRGHQMGDCAGDKCPDWITRQAAIITAALTTARKDAREVAFKDAKAALQAPTPGTMASTEFHKGFESMRRLGIRAVEAAANTEEGEGDG